MENIFHDVSTYTHQDIDELIIGSTNSGDPIITIRSHTQHNEIESTDEELSYCFSRSRIDELINALEKLKNKSK